ncbi:bifunctional riboflavin kinase/FAD synthetase [Winogradskyella maritima]|uniref:Riboflavin biosynthesis protein n=1 Tax=Winogradskyella maritima TaxID=1517766 RepID=A0ABV8AFF3_9FLAO|nr:bifunctional riboflavin kinase/FAD synthetase [Winogradskyella maritima]
MNTKKINITNQYHSKALTIGTFDGVHIGHQKILSRVIESAHQKGMESAVLTLFPHPRMVLEENSSIKLLHTIEERIALLKHFGIQNVIVKPFTKTFANLSPRDYVKDILVDELHTKVIIIGYDHHFGKDRSANIHDLKDFGNEFDFEVEEITAQDIENVTVSSTKIRNALFEGEIETANTYLGYHYFITGIVVTGQRLGRQLGYPTANIKIREDYKLIPKDGVYVVQSKIEEQTVYGMMNIGSNPTIANKERTIEVHFFELDQKLYDCTLKIEFLKRLRDEYKFDSLEDLKNQLKKDEDNALAVLKDLV